MNPGLIKWNVSVTATIDNKKVSKKELKELRKEIKEFNLSDSFFDKKKMKLSKKSDKIVIKSDFNKDINSPYKLDFSFEGIKSLMKWFPKVIEDRDWDHSYIIDALRFKIQNTCKYIETKQRHLNWENDVKYMKLALSLMDKLWPDMFSEEIGYESEYGEYHETVPRLHGDIKWKKLKKEDGSPKGSRQMKIKEISEKFDEYFAKNKLMHKKAVAYIDKHNLLFTEPRSKFSQAMIISKLKHEKARKLLFNILEQKIENWWD